MGRGDLFTILSQQMQNYKESVGGTIPTDVALLCKLASLRSGGLEKGSYTVSFTGLLRRT